MIPIIRLYISLFSILILAQQMASHNQNRNLMKINLSTGKNAIQGVISFLQSKYSSSLNWKNDKNWEQRFQFLYSPYSQFESIFDVQIGDERKENLIFIKKLFNLVFSTYATNAQGICFKSMKLNYQEYIELLNQNLNKLLQTGKNPISIEDFEIELFEESEHKQKLLKLYEQKKEQEKQLDLRIDFCQDFTQFISQNIQFNKHLFNLKSALQFFNEQQKFRILEDDEKYDKDYEVFFDILNNYLVDENVAKEIKQEYYQDVFYLYIDIFLQENELLH